MITLLAVNKPLNHSQFKIFSIFNTEVWLVILLSLILMSIFNTKFNTKKQYPILTFGISIINHFEQLVCKSGKQIN